MRNPPVAAARAEVASVSRGCVAHNRLARTGNPVHRNRFCTRGRDQNRRVGGYRETCRAVTPELPMKAAAEVLISTPSACGTLSTVHTPVSLPGLQTGQVSVGTTTATWIKARWVEPVTVSQRGSIDSELRRIAASRRASRQRGGPLTSIDVADALLDERRGQVNQRTSSAAFHSRIQRPNRPSSVALKTQAAQINREADQLFHRVARRKPTP